MYWFLFIWLAENAAHVHTPKRFDLYADTNLNIPNFSDYYEGGIKIIDSMLTCIYEIFSYSGDFPPLKILHYVSEHYEIIFIDTEIECNIEWLNISFKFKNAFRFTFINFIAIILSCIIIIHIIVKTMQIALLIILKKDITDKNFGFIIRLSKDIYNVYIKAIFNKIKPLILNLTYDNFFNKIKLFILFLFILFIYKQTYFYISNLPVIITSYLLLLTTITILLEYLYNFIKIIKLSIIYIWNLFRIDLALSIKNILITINFYTLICRAKFYTSVVIQFNHTNNEYLILPYGYSSIIVIFIFSLSILIGLTLLI